jgi:hypothetical protein
MPLCRLYSTLVLHALVRRKSAPLHAGRMSLDYLAMQAMHHKYSQHFT